jgi:hypothetical protein
VLNTKQMQIEKINIDDNEAIMLTKVVSREKLDVCGRLVDMTSKTLHNVGRGSLLSYIPPCEGVLST